MEIKDVAIWKPIEFSEAWERCSTSKLDVLLPSWVRRRLTLKEDSKAYHQFMERLKRQHAIETGVIEKLYDLSEGVTETFIKEGFVESYLQHGDTNIPPHQLMNYLNDNFSAIDFVFDVVKNNRTFTVSFIKELHQLITRHQDTAEGRDQFGTRLQIPLLKGKFKERENNPTRADGTRFLYCPPIHVDAEMDRLVTILADLEEKGVKPLLAATWLHHAFVSIHPFQDGNGRVARLLASLVLIKHGLFPLTVKRGEKKRYIDGLELADNGEPQKLVDYFGEMQKKNIEGALNMDLNLELSNAQLDEVVSLLTEKLEMLETRESEDKERLIELESKRGFVHHFCEIALNEICSEIENKSKGYVSFSVLPYLGDFERDKIYNHHSEFMWKNGLSLNLDLPFSEFSVQINLSNDKSYSLLFSINHFGNTEYSLAISSMFVTVSNTYFLIEPFTLSIEPDSEELEQSYNDIYEYLNSVLTLALAQIASEINP